MAVDGTATHADGRDGPSPKRPSAHETRERAAEAYRLRDEFGAAHSVIAEQLGCHRTTVSRLIASEKRRIAREFGRQFDAAEAIAIQLERAERKHGLAMLTYQRAIKAGDLRAALRALIVAMRADDRVLTVLQTTGLVPHDFGTLRIEAQRDRLSAGDVRRLAESVRAHLAAGPDTEPDDLTPIGERRFLEGDAATALDEDHEAETDGE